MNFTKIFLITASCFILSLVIIDQATYTYASVDVENEQWRNDAREYLRGVNLTESQIEYTLDQSRLARDPDHFIARFGAIFFHERGSSSKFIDGSTNFLAGRLKQEQKYKSFTSQLDGRLGAYNRYRYKHNTTSGRLDISRYCVSDTHGGGHGCPNWRRGVPIIIQGYKNYNYASVTTKQTNEPIYNTQDYGYFDRAQLTQIKLNTLKVKARELRRKCKEVGECTK